MPWVLVMARHARHQRAWPWFVGAGAVYAGTLVGTWWPRAGPGEPNLVPFRSHVQDIRRGARTPEAAGALTDLVINVALLMPAALLLAGGFQRLGGQRGCIIPTVVIGGIGSVMIEGGQICIPGRVPDVTDVVLNSLGAGLSSAMVALWDVRPARRRR
jgi:glycopeptide antibiotics resistance protein